AKANLCGADLSGALLTNATFDDTNCAKVCFLNTNITYDQLVQANTLAGAVLPDGRVVALIRSSDSGTIQLPSFLHFYQWNETYSAGLLDELDMFGVRFAGVFTRISVRAADLSHACLRGIFSRMTCDHARLNFAHLNGRFVKTTFKFANFANASF